MSRQISGRMPAKEEVRPAGGGQRRADNDRRIVAQLQRREPRVMSEIYDRYGKAVYAVILGIVRSPALAEDLVQETFLRVWSRGHLFDVDRGALGSWIIAVARNRAIDYLRSGEGRIAMDELDMDRLVGNRGGGSHAEARALSIDYQQRLAQALGKLTDSHREVITMAYYGGYSHSEMARNLKQPLGTIKTWVRAALKTLRVELRDQDSRAAVDPQGRQPIACS